MRAAPLAFARALALLAPLIGAAAAQADPGVLIPSSEGNEPDPSKLALERMDVRVRLDRGHARVELRQRFRNLTGAPLEGRYVLPLGPRAAVSELALYEGARRLTGVVVEKPRGRRLYERLARQGLDPGLLESGDDKDERGLFSLRVAPILPYATTRVELAYQEELPIASLRTSFQLPLKPRRFRAQKVGLLRVELVLEEGAPMAGIRVAPQRGFTFSAPPRDGATRVAGVLEARDVTLSDDLVVEYGLAPAEAALEVLAFRDGRPRQDVSPFGEGRVYADARGYFVARALIAPAGGAVAGGAGAPGRPRDVALLLDTSGSMQWEKLERSYAALEYFLGRLGPRDRFGLVLFDDAPRPFRRALAAADQATVADALRFVGASGLGGGTDLGAAIEAGLGLLGAGTGAERDRFVVVITDGHPTLGEITARRLAERVARANRAAGGGGRTARLFVFGVGDDSNVALLGRLADEGDGAFSWVREAGDLAFALRTFLDKLGQQTIRDVALALTGAQDVYPARQPTLFDGSDALFYGRYAAPAPAARAALTGRIAGRTLERAVVVALPAEARERPWIARGWAKRRVDDLLARISRDGEREAWVREIVALAREHRLVTPYTSFIAAPRAFLRPRVIQPGDPLLRVHAGPEIARIAAVLPFGPIKALRYVPDEDVWETRFVAPAWLRDGDYAATLVLTDRRGHKLEERKTFRIDGQAPTLAVTPARGAVRAGERLAVSVDADADTRTLRARLGDGPEATLTWDPRLGRSTGEVRVSPELPTGTWPLIVVAEDFAHNVSSRELPIAVLGR